MEHKIKATFDSISASAALKNMTLNNVREQLPRQTKKKAGKRVWSALGVAAASVVAILLVVGMQVYSRETAYISLDINPSISLSINDYNRVIDAAAYNKEGQEILEGVNIQNKPYDEAVQLIIDSEPIQPYLAADKAMLLVAVQANDPAKETLLQGSLQKTVDVAVRQHHLGVSVEYCGVSGQMRQEAESYGVSAGKYQAIKQPQELNPNVTVEEYADCPMRDINSEIEQCHGGEMQEKRSGNGMGGNVADGTGAATENSFGDGNNSNNSNQNGSGSGSAQAMPSSQNGKNTQSHTNGGSGNQSNGNGQQGSEEPPAPEQSTVVPSNAGSGANHGEKGGGSGGMGGGMQSDASDASTGSGGGHGNGKKN